MNPAELAAAVARAQGRLDARPRPRLTCGSCGHEDEVPDDPEKSIYTCDKCGGRTAFGVLMPRIVNTPHTDRRFILSRFEHGRDAKRVEVAFTLDREYAAQYALDLLSVCAPEQWKALQALFAAKPGKAPRPAEDAVTALVEGRTPSGPPPAPPPSQEAAKAPPEPERVPGPAAAPAPPQLCPCGKPSAMANGACADCARAAIG